MRALHMLGRMIFGGFFAYSGINHLQNSEGMGQYAGAKGVRHLPAHRRSHA